ncbi:hypothetical protein [Janibacter sp. GXQ6167]|uniref:hypothetical protein n=1 Tax=Janibacter sp. GXQ6167 TaxID=3240791 RepID=UPI0035245CA3
MRSINELLASAADSHGPTSRSDHEVAAAAWALGRRRARGRMAVTVAAAAAIVTAIAVIVAPLLPSSGALAPADGTVTRVGVAGYPERIEEPWLVRPMPQRPGPVAMAYRWSDADRQRSAIRVVTEQGTVFVVSGTERPLADLGPASPPTVSADGTVLAYFTDAKGPYVIHDLVTGERREYPSVKPAGKDWVNGTAQVGWISPDDRTAMVQIVDGSTTGVVLNPDGSIDRLPAAACPEGPAAWLRDDQIVCFEVIGDATTARIVSPKGQVLHEQILTEPKGVIAGGLSGRQPEQRGALADGGRSLDLLVLDGGVSGEAAVIRYAIDGMELRSPKPVGYLGSNDGWLGVSRDGRAVIPWGWVDRRAGQEPSSAAGQGDGGVTGLSYASATPTAAGQGAPGIDVRPPWVVMDPRLGVLNTTTWASDALAGEGHSSVMGTSDNWFSWWWRELVAAGLALAVLAVVGVRVGRRNGVRARARDRNLGIEGRGAPAEE